MLIPGDCFEQLKLMPNDSVDSVVTDPPYGLKFMNKHWDYDVPTIETWKEVLRVLKPGGHLLSFGGTRTYHRMVVAIEDAGFEIRDQIQWIYGSGFPKSLNCGEGRGTALKPANEPIVLARKPLSEKTVAKNIERWGTGAINVDVSRVFTKERLQTSTTKIKKYGGRVYMDSITKSKPSQQSPQGRFPANVIFDEVAAEMLDRQSGVLGSRPNAQPKKLDTSPRWYENKDPNKLRVQHSDIYGGASRFFYCAKASKSERNAGLEGMDNGRVILGQRRCKKCGLRELNHERSRCNCNEPDFESKFEKQSPNSHPTVKPLKLMRYLISLVTPKGGIVLDPFMGSGTTGVAAKSKDFQFIGIERDHEYFEIANKRIGEEQ